MGGGYEKIIEALYKKYHVKESERFNPCKTITILLADDDNMCNTATRKMIQDAGRYQVNPFFTGLDLCNYYEELEEEVGAIILDYEMPERNGPESARYLRNFELTKQKRRVPIIGLTGYENERVKQECIDAGMDIVLSKPIKKRDIISTLSKII